MPIKTGTTLDGIGALAVASERLLRALADKTVDRFLSSWPAAAQQTRTPQPSTLQVLGWLADACAAGPPETREVLDRLLALSPRLAWAQTYTAADIGGSFLDRYGWTELIGRRGPVASDRIAAGFLLLGPDTEYPAHSHDAEEIYLPLSGVAAWQRGTEAWRERRPNAPIHHPSGMPHAMRTAREPLLALYLWRGGDLTEKSRLG